MFGWLFGRRPKKPKWTIRLDSSLQFDAARAATWLVYAGVQTMVRDGSYLDLHPEARGRNTPFDEECFARDALGEHWGVQPIEKQSSDPYLQLLVKIRAAGLIREYVWRYLRQDDWPQPADLDLARLDLWWAEQGLGKHVPITLASAVPG